MQRSEDTRKLKQLAVDKNGDSSGVDWSENFLWCWNEASVSTSLAERATVREMKLHRQKFVTGEIVASVQTMSDGERFRVGKFRREKTEAAA